MTLLARNTTASLIDFRLEIELRLLLGNLLFSLQLSFRLDIFTKLHKSIRRWLVALNLRFVTLRRRVRWLILSWPLVTLTLVHVKGAWKYRRVLHRIKFKSIVLLIQQDRLSLFNWLLLDRGCWDLWVSGWKLIELIKHCLTLILRRVKILYLIVVLSD